MELYFVRHPKTVASEGICYGQTDLSIAEAELEKVYKEVLRKITIDEDTLLFSSPLQRCRLLAQLLDRGHSLTTDSRLMEMDFGCWEMRAWADIPLEQQKEWSDDLLHSNPYKGEALADVITRVQSFWNEMMINQAKRVVISTHAGVMYALLIILLQATPSKIYAMDIQYGDIIKVTVSSSEYYKIKFL